MSKLPTTDMECPTCSDQRVVWKRSGWNGDPTEFDCPDCAGRPCSRYEGSLTPTRANPHGLWSRCLTCDHERSAHAA